MKVRATRINFDRYLIAHIAWGVFGVASGMEWLTTVIYLFKQALDVIGGENVADTSGDVAEYAIGLALGWLIFKLWLNI